MPLKTNQKIEMQTNNNNKVHSKKTVISTVSVIKAEAGKRGGDWRLNRVRIQSVRPQRDLALDNAIQIAIYSSLHHKNLKKSL